jgi:hypothetical protein
MVATLVVIVPESVVNVQFGIPYEACPKPCPVPTQAAPEEDIRACDALIHFNGSQNCVEAARSITLIDSMRFASPGKTT